MKKIVIRFAQTFQTEGGRYSAIYCTAFVFSIALLVLFICMSFDVVKVNQFKTHLVDAGFVFIGSLFGVDTVNNFSKK